jgi:hypothetical protein
MNDVNEDIANFILTQTYRNILLLGRKYAIISITENYKMTSVRISDLFNFFQTLLTFSKNLPSNIFIHTLNVPVW